MKRLLTLPFLLVLLPISGLALAQAGDPEELQELIPSVGPNYLSAPGTPSTEGNLGALTYRYAVEVPPGTGGHTPRVGLAYSSLSGNSPYGFGWSLTPGSSIQRTTRFGVPSYGPSDRYEIDGELLVVDQGDLTRYFLERHNGSRIHYDATGDRWTVVQPDGTELRYGFTANSRLRKSALAASAPPTFQWLLDEVIDPRGNSYRIEYEPDTYTIDGSVYAAFLYPRRIRYSFHEAPGAPVGPLQASRLIELRWESGRGTPADYPTFYRSGFRVQIRKRLQEIVTGITTDGDPNALSTSEQLRRYVLTYAPKATPATPLETPYSRLVSIQRFGLNNTAFPTPTTFDYALPPLGFSNSHDTIDNPSATAGDSFNDPSDVASDNQTTDIFDLDGDGMVDRVFQNAVLKVHYGQPSGGFAGGTATALQAGCPSSGSGSCNGVDRELVPGRVQQCSDPSCGESRRPRRRWASRLRRLDRSRQLDLVAEPGPDRLRRWRRLGACLGER